MPRFSASVSIKWKFRLNSYRLIWPVCLASALVFTFSDSNQACRLAVVIKWSVKERSEVIVPVGAVAACTTRAK